MPSDRAGKQLLRWFRQRGWKPFPFQRETWAAYLDGESGLVHAPTGTGKSYAVWAGPLLEGLQENPERGRPRPPLATSAAKDHQRPAAKSRAAAAPPLRVLWITPLRALAHDTVMNLRALADGLETGWTVEARTGDTSSHAKAKQRNQFPTALVTTPESLSVLLSYPETRERFRELRCVVVDEWHELLGTKRGVQTELCLARLRAWQPALRTWGLSATLGNLDEALQVLMGRHSRVAHYESACHSSNEALTPASPSNRHTQAERRSPDRHVSTAEVQRADQEIGAPVQGEGEPELPSQSSPSDATTAGFQRSAARPGCTPPEAGATPAPRCRLISGDLKKKTVIETLLPVTMDRFPWAGHLGIQLVEDVAKAVERARTTLVFCNTRSQVEHWHRALQAARPGWGDDLGIHHGSIDREQRELTEQRLRAGNIRAVVCTSSLDLGVDFSPVEQVIQIGGPKGVARLLQRAGRSGHQPGAVSRVLCVPTLALELVEYAAAREAVARRDLEARAPLQRPLDVLAQHLVTVALGEGFTEAEMLAEICTAHAYRELTDDEWRWTMDFITRGGATLTAYPQFRRVIERDGRFLVESQPIARLHRMSIGTITSDTAIAVRWLSGGLLGTIEESFIARLKPRSRFIFAGHTVELVRVHFTTAYVRKAKRGAAIVPSWQGGRSPLSSQLAQAVREQLERARREIDGNIGSEQPSALTPALSRGEREKQSSGELRTDLPRSASERASVPPLPPGEGRGEGGRVSASNHPASLELRAVRPILEVQAAWSRIPALDELLIERTATREGVHHFAYPFAGRLVHEGLGALLAYRFGKTTPNTFTVTATDYGIELLGAKPVELTETDWRAALSPDGLLDELLACLNSTELARRQFREIARVAGLVFQGFPGANKSAKQLQASSSLFYDTFAQYDPRNLLLDQARREVLERELQFTRLRDTLERIREMKLVLMRPERLTPFAFPLWADMIRGQVSTEKWDERVARVVAQLEAAAPQARKLKG